ncbi:hypothetical protein [Aeromicrobium chenweiae]|uniref:Uncharacterized protein n=1 Tax=Aeromicrobium chenweiae TaxID=2079793 RepID=A0A2S0WJQ4_9ACTN|nr:hypothetical protein [Aeromicrobium chenweiae]AWB91504.1 hypothetical protein C3E78_04315 [Aeromicrobium chenweiae]TGN32339.1 hypothetical protein E4L97_06280 [Aeromicrobium chenweiae]
MSAISTLIALPYELARLPLATIDHRLSSRLPETSRPRTTLDRAIGTADKIAGAALHNDKIAARGADRIDRTEKLLKAERLDEQAEARRAEAQVVAETGRRQAARERQAAARQAASAPTEAKKAEDKSKRQAAARASATETKKKAAADRTAAQRTETVEQRKKRVAQAAEAKKAAARREAKAELDDARESKQSAAEARSDAEALSDLTEAKKQDRQKD